MRDPETFAKLFRVHFPRPEWASWYVTTLARSPEYANLPELQRAYEALEDELAERGEHSGRARKRAIDALIGHIGKTEAYAAMLEQQVTERIPRFDRRMEHVGQWVISADVRRANDNNMRRFDAAGELGDSWEDVCAEVGVAPVLAASKSLRQHVYGRLEPKRNQRLQQRITRDAVEDAVRSGACEEEQVVLQLHDEFVVAPGGDDVECVGVMRALEEVVSRAPVGFRVVAQRFRSIERGYYVVEHGRIDADELAVRHKSLFKVPGPLFYLYFRQHVLGEEVQERDLYFRSEGRLATWVIDEG